MRRSSPDAPQGIVPVLTLFAGLILVIALTAGSFGSSGGGDQTKSGSKTDTAMQAKPGYSSFGTKPTSTLIVGRTTLFVATTTPYTTTSSTTTTTTTKAENSLTVRPTGILFPAGSDSASMTVRTTSKSAVRFFVISLPDGITASPATGRVTRSKPVTVQLTLSDPDRTQSGSLTVVGNDGSEIRVPVEVAGKSFGIGTVALQPSPPRCNQSAQISVTVTGDVATSVSVRVGPEGGGGSTVTLLAMVDGTWLGTLPAVARGTSVTATVTATGGSGQTAERVVGYYVSGGTGC